MVKKQQLTMDPGQVNNPNGITNRQFKEQRKAGGQNYKGNNFTQRIGTTDEENQQQRNKVQSMHGKGAKDGRQEIESIEGDISNFMSGDPDKHAANSAMNSDDEMGRASPGSEGEDNDQGIDKRNHA